MEVLKWARSNGCPWSETTCIWAEKGGHLELLEWARRNGCPWDRAPPNRPLEEANRLAEAPPGTPTQARRIDEGPSDGPDRGVVRVAGGSE